MLRALILAALLTLTADTREECFTDSCVGCIDDCLGD